MIEGLQIKILIGVLVALWAVTTQLEEGYRTACDVGWQGEYRPAEKGENGYPGWGCYEGTRPEGEG